LIKTHVTLQYKYKKPKTVKKIFKSRLIWVVSALTLAGCFSTSTISQSGADVPVTYQTFYDGLSPYGTWIDYPEYGHVWSPGVEEDFRPYATNGHWVYSDEGWAWASDYAWGWAPFHYGSWLYDDNYGWLWIAGYNWSPAWVTWGNSGDDYCWAPLMPGVGITSEFSSWRPPSYYWNACGRSHIYDHNLTQVIERPDRMSDVARNISVINNFGPTRMKDAYYSKGPDVQEVQKYVQPRIQPASIREVHTFTEAKHSGNQLNVYRPVVQDPKVTVQQHPQQVQQPKEFRRTDNTASKPITKEEQRPVMQHPFQRNNVHNLPVSHGNNGTRGNNGGGRQPGKN
jgi:hypothetical protein